MTAKDDLVMTYQYFDYFIFLPLIYFDSLIIARPA